MGDYFKIDIIIKRNRKQNKNIEYVKFNKTFLK